MSRKYAYDLFDGGDIVFTSLRFFRNSYLLKILFIIKKNLDEILVMVIFSEYTISSPILY